MRRLPALVLCMGVWACGDTPPPPVEPPPAPRPDPSEAAPAPPAPVCTWQARSEGGTVRWTAFKFTEKTGVSGGFPSVRITPGKVWDAPWKALDGVGFSLDTDSVDSENPERDAKIRALFFGTMTDTKEIRGVVKAHSEGRATARITMNGVTHPVRLDVARMDDQLTLRGTIDVSLWGGATALQALHAECEDLHRGADGVSKLWSEVEVVATVPVEQTCK